MLPACFPRCVLINPSFSVPTQIIIQMYIIAHCSWDFSLERFVGVLCDYVSTELIGLAGPPAESRQVADNLPLGLTLLLPPWVWAGAVLLLLCSTRRSLPTVPCPVLVPNCNWEIWGLTLGLQQPLKSQVQKELGSRIRDCKVGLGDIHGNNWVELGACVNPYIVWKIMLRHVFQLSIAA